MAQQSRVHSSCRGPMCGSQHPHQGAHKASPGIWHLSTGIEHLYTGVGVCTKVLRLMWQALHQLKPSISLARFSLPRQDVCFCCIFLHLHECVICLYVCMYLYGCVGALVCLYMQRPHLETKYILQISTSAGICSHTPISITYILFLTTE